MAKTTEKSVTKSKEFKLPRYLRLDKGAMWLDTDGDSASGVRLYAGNTRLVGRGKVNEVFEHGHIRALEDQPDIGKDQFKNGNFVEYGMVEEQNES